MGEFPKNSQDIEETPECILEEIPEGSPGEILKNETLKDFFEKLHEEYLNDTLVLSLNGYFKWLKWILGTIPKKFFTETREEFLSNFLESSYVVIERSFWRIIGEFFKGVLGGTSVEILEHFQKYLWRKINRKGKLGGVLNHCGNFERNSTINFSRNS